MANYCLRGGVEVWYKPRTKWVVFGKDLSWDVAVSIQETLRKLNNPCYIVFPSRVR
jgi:hypothetical protein